jgi:2-desacetyl-2-hydroxyethyl bacteriochlorophyllide A dehydrogenase
MEQIAKPACPPGKALVKVMYAGICGSDLHILRKGMFITNTPVTMGHEFSGVVEDIGEGLTEEWRGLHVVGDPRVSCGKCRWCNQDDFNLCPDLGFIGEVAPGCFADYIVADPRKLLIVPPSLDLRLAALAEPLAVALHILHQIDSTVIGSLGIVGAGPIGLLTLIAAKALSDLEVTVVDISPVRLQAARNAGADKILVDIPGKLSESVDVVVEAAGKEAALRGALKWIKPKGSLVMAGLYEETISIDPNDILTKELVLSGINAYKTVELKDAITLLARGTVDVSMLISHILPLESAVKAFSFLTAARLDAVKVLLAP